MAQKSQGSRSESERDSRAALLMQTGACLVRFCRACSSSIVVATFQSGQSPLMDFGDSNQSTNIFCILLQLRGVPL